jgi:hypothetical protein
MDRSSFIGLVCLGITSVEWIILVLVAVLLPGGHPPLTAYLAYPVIISTVFFSAVGLAVIGVGLRTRIERRALGIGLMAGNGVFFGLALYLLIMY